MGLRKPRGGGSVPSIMKIEGTPSATAGQTVLVHSFSGFMDAGSASQIAVKHLLESCPERVIATFDSDALLDYRARRPKMIYDRDRFVSAEWPEITLREVLDERGTPFLLLSGPEPDYRWREFVDAIIWLVGELDIRLTAGMIGIPWPAPHTRPVGITFHGTDPELIMGHRSSLSTMEIPGHVQAILELTLGDAGHNALGLAVHVPHYLTQFDYPRASIALLRGLSGSTGLVLPSDGLEEQAPRRRDGDRAADQRLGGVRAPAAIDGRGLRPGRVGQQPPGARLQRIVVRRPARRRPDRCPSGAVPGRDGRSRRRPGALTFSSLDSQA